MDPYFLQWLALIAVFSLAVISPGPDFVITVRNALVYSRRSGIMTSLGLSIAILFHVTYTVLGISALIAQSIFLFTLIKLAGACYLIYIGSQAIRSKGAGQKALDAANRKTAFLNKDISDFSAVRSGFLTNVLNPKASLFFLAIFSQIISPETPFIWLCLYGATCSIMMFIWFSLVTLFLNQNKIKQTFLGLAKWIDRVSGALLIALGIKVALSHR